MLYERWRQIAREHRNEIALRVLATGERWTFGQLDAAVEDASSSEPVLFPQGREFVLTLLRAWRSGKPACPLEPEQTPPTLNELPPGCIHL